MASQSNNKDATASSNLPPTKKAKTLTCSVVSPFGRELAAFTKAKTIIPGLRDALRGHRSLYKTGQILHQDIHPFNIIIPEYSVAPEPGDPRGVLIDLDNSFDVTDGPAPPSKYGPGAFVALSRIRGEKDTYVQDLEAFMYTLCWVATPSDQEEEESNGGGAGLARWMGRDKSAEEAMAEKQADVSRDGFGRVVAGFRDGPASAMAELARELRDVLFGRQDEHLGGGRDPGPEEEDRVYEGMLAAFEKAAEKVAEDED